MSETFGNGPLTADVVDKNVQEWERIGGAVAFRLPNGDEILIARKVLCPDCGHVYVMGLANGNTVSYARRHPSCSVNNQVVDRTEDEEDGEH